MRFDPQSSRWRLRAAVLAVTLVATSVGPTMRADSLALPVVTKNVELLGNIPDVAGISATFDPDRPYLYVSTVHGIDVFDVTTPERPALVGTLPLGLWENENVNLGAIGTAPDGTRFVLMGVDFVGALTPTAPGASSLLPQDGESGHVYVIDVTDPTAPFLRSNLPVSTYTHTVSCIDPACSFAYTAGDMERFSVIDLTDIDAPFEARVVDDPWGWHDWQVDAAGVAWKAGDNGSVAYDISDPLAPVVLNSTDESGLTGAEWNDLIHHNSHRPYATRMPLDPSDHPSDHPSLAPDVFAGNVLLVTEENLSPGVCADEAALQTWHVPSLRAGDTADGKPGGGSIEPLDSWQSEVYDTGTKSPVGINCSAHYFDFHQDGFVAQSWYNHGVRILDVRDPADIKQVGYFVLDVQQTWSSYWVPARDAAGHTVTGPDGEAVRTNIVYSIDAVRGIDILRVTLPSTAPALTAAVRAPVLTSWLERAGTITPVASELAGATPSFVCRLTTARPGGPA